MDSLNTLKNNKEKALFLAKKQLPELVFDVVNLEGIHYTLPEIMTLLDCVTIGGKRQQDELITNNQIKSWQKLFELISNKTFKVDKNTVCILHKIVAKAEALTYGIFRDAQVLIAGTDYLPPKDVQLNNIWQSNFQNKDLVLVGKDNHIVYQYAISVFLKITRNQFFFDGNKRTGRLMMNGILLSHGLPVINLPAKRQLEFNQLMIQFYPTGDESAMQTFMLSCLDSRIIRIMQE